MIGVEPLVDHPVSRGQLCAKGWSTAFGIDGGHRVKSPMIKEHGQFRPASWNEALGLIAENFSGIADQFGSDALGVISSARATNEDNYAAQKFTRAVLGTNNIDHCARICHSPSVAGLKQTLGSGAMSNSIDDVERADVIVVFGADSTESHPIIGGRIIRAKLRGAKLIVVDPRKTRLAELADIHLQLRLGTNIALINGMLNVIFSKGWQDSDFIASRCENVEPLKHHVSDYNLERVEEITGVPGELVTAAAQMYATADAAFLAYGMGITQYVSGTNNVIAISNLVLACGQIGRPGTGVNPLRGQNNVQGACDMGCLPNVYPDYQDAMSAEVQQKFSDAWGVRLPSRPGLTSLGMSASALEGRFQGLLLMGEDPVVTDPDQHQVKRALRAMDFVVVVELSMTETALCADVVLPAVSFAEKDGTFTNCERRVQLVRQAVAPLARAKADWKILSELAAYMGKASLMGWSRPEEIFDEMAGLTSSFSGMSYEKLAKDNGLQWPCNEEHPDGSPYLHHGQFSIGRARFIPVRQTDPAEIPDKNYPLYLTTTRLFFHYGCGSMTRESPLLERETPVGLLSIHPRDAEQLQVGDGMPITVSSRRGKLDTCAHITDQVPEGVVAMPYHFREAPSNILTNNAQDPVTKMPELKACAVKVEPRNDVNSPHEAQTGTNGVSTKDQGESFARI